MSFAQIAKILGFGVAVVVEDLANGRIIRFVISTSPLRNLRL